MEKSDFISLIKSQSNELVETWNNNRKNVPVIMVNMQVVIALYQCLYEDGVTSFELGNLGKKHPLSELAVLAKMLFDCRQKQELGDLSEELSAAILSVQQQIEQLPVPKL